MNNDKTGNISSSLHRKNKMDGIKSFQALPEITIVYSRDSFCVQLQKIVN
jgi:predicted DNA-binding helix-hairpin-helix protein